jgi:hypothetical protein
MQVFLEKESDILYHGLNGYEYGIIAVNDGGNSVPSNTADVVL